MASYGLLLYASRSAPLSLVSAARESGVLFATLLGWWFLDERVTGFRWIAALLIAAGVVLLGLRAMMRPEPGRPRRFGIRPR